MEDLRPFFLAAGREFSKLPPRSEARLRALERFHGRIESYLTAEQRNLLAEILTQARERHAAGE